MSQGELISVITPAFNAAAFVGDAVRSVLGQTYPELEMLVVDDGSDDATAAVAREAAGGDPRIRVVRRPRNEGTAAARTRGLEEARGRYLAFLDADDLWLPTKLEQQLAFMRERQAALAFTQFRRIDRGGALVSGVIPIPDHLDYHRLLGNNAIATSTVMLDRERTGSIRINDAFHDDFALWLDLLKRGFIAHGLRVDLMRYRIVPGSLSRNKLQSAFHTWEVYRQVEHLSVPNALWYFLNYVWNGWRKYRV